VVSYTPRPLYPQGKSPYPLNRRLDGPQSPSRRGGEEKNSQPGPGIRFHKNSVRGVTTAGRNATVYSQLSSDGGIRGVRAAQWCSVGLRAG
jgi:hypothetical protein